MPETFT